MRLLALIILCAALAGCSSSEKVEKPEANYFGCHCSSLTAYNYNGRLVAGCQCKTCQCKPKAKCTHDCHCGEKKE